MEREQPWIFRTYAGHSSARASNVLYKSNLERGQKGLSIAFDLPTQCGYSSDHPLARPEIGKVGVPINSIDDLAVLFDGIPLSSMNTSMTINGTSMWLLALYVALARTRGDDVKALAGTTQNDVIKEYLARGTYIFPPEPSLRIIAEMYEWCADHAPRWNPQNICSYHLQEAGATPAQELAFALANATATLDLLRARGHVAADRFDACAARMSFFVNAGIRFIEEMCKMRAFTTLWDRILAERYGVADPQHRRFRYGVQVNSLGLTESQPENNAWRILLQALAVTLSRDARCRSLQLPAWNEALSLPRPWDQQWSLRLQQVLAYETDLLEYPDLFAGSPVIENKVGELIAAAEAELSHIASLGGVVAAVESGYLKKALVRSMTERIGRINRGDLVVVGVNKWQDGLPSPLVSGEDGGIFQVDPGEVDRTLENLQRTRAERDAARVDAALAALEQAARGGHNMMEASIECALARVTTGEWADTLRGAFGEYRADTGVGGQSLDFGSRNMERVQSRVAALVKATGHRPRILVAKPGLDGHSNGAEVIAVATGQVGFEVIYAGIRQAPAQIVATAVQEDVDMIGLSVLSGSHVELATEILSGLRAAGAGDIPVILGGIVPKPDIEPLKRQGIADVFTNEDFDLATVLLDLVSILEARANAPGK